MTLAQDSADVLIIGAGAAGGVAALRLAEAGVKVVCLEQGEWPDRAKYPGTTDEWELVSRKQWSSAPGLRGSPSDYPVEINGSDVGVLNFNGVGGGTVLYAAHWPRLLPSDFRTHSTYGHGDDWPIGYEELAPFYERVDRQFGVSGLGGNPCYPPGADPPLPPLPIGAGGLAVARAHARLGWHWWPEPNAILSNSYDGRHPCVQRGTCGQGCNEGAKASADMTHWSKVVALGGTVITGARVTRLTVDHNGMVDGAEWTDTVGQEHFQPANAVLCAANGIGTPRLLLNSASDRFPDGLANRSGLVGRRLMLHPLATIVGFFEDNLRSWQGQSGSSIHCLEFYETDAERGFVGGAKWSLTPTGGPLRAALSGPIGPVWGEAHHDHVGSRFGHGASWAVLGEDLPDERNRVELSTTLVDGAGAPAPAITYRLSENSRRLIDWHLERAGESLVEAGAVSLESSRFLPNGHLLGTARMGRSPSGSVVDQWCIAHDVPNLGIIDGSVFVTAGAVNPTSTITALALRSAEHLLETRQSMPTPTRRTLHGPFPQRGHAAVVLQTGRAREPGLTDGERSTMILLADALIPAGSTMPSASEAGAGAAATIQVLRSRPDLTGALVRALRPFDGSAAGRLAALATDDPSAYNALLLTVAGGYYMNRDVRSRLGYAGQEAVVINPHEYPQYVEEGLLDHVLARSGG